MVPREWTEWNGGREDNLRTSYIHRGPQFLTHPKLVLPLKIRRESRITELRWELSSFRESRVIIYILFYREDRCTSENKSKMNLTNCSLPFHSYTYVLVSYKYKLDFLDPRCKLQRS